MKAKELKPLVRRMFYLLDKQYHNSFDEAEIRCIVKVIELFGPLPEYVANRIIVRRHQVPIHNQRKKDDV